MLTLVMVLAVAIAGIDWSPSVELALERAKTEGKVVFVAINMDGEYANDRMAKKVYRDKGVVKLASQTINLVASRDEHRGGEKACPRLGGVPCQVHLDTDREIRKRGIVNVGSGGQVVAPQHIFLDPEGQVILSVPYAVSESELAWCFHTALSAVDPKYRTRGGRSPRRLIMKGVVDPDSDERGGEGAGGGVLDRDAALELLKEAKSTSHTDMHRLFGRIITADEPEARAYAKSQFGSTWMNWRGTDTLKGSIRAVGEISPPSYWEVLLPLSKQGEPAVRAEVAVAFEQLADPRSLKDALAAYKKEEEASVQKEWLRAIGAVGEAQKKAKKALLRPAMSTRSRDEALRVNAIVAIGSLTIDDELAQFLTGLLGDESPLVRRAAACAQAFSREPRFAGPLAAARAKETDEAVTEAIDVASTLLTGSATLGDLGREIKAVTDSEIPRHRIFGY